MAPSSRRRSRSQIDDEDTDSSHDGSSSSSVASPKRQRISPDSDSENDVESSRPAAPHTNGDKPSFFANFQPGAIVRVSVVNFVTFEKADFFPGPSLNMVVGPNGAGKSSLVCAICLGLGYSPKNLGRAGSVKEYVKHGKDFATIEIELKKRPQDRNNHIVKVQIRRDQNTQKWWLNGKDATAKAVQTLVQSLKIQVDNLCSFLPQDRVVEFAQSTPVGLLRETLRAAAPEHVSEWQAQLQDLHKEKKSLEESSGSDVALLKNLENRQQGLQADVDRLREREEVQQRIEDLNKALIAAKYNDATRNHAAAKNRKKEAQNTLRRLEQDSGPALEAVNKKEEYAQRIGDAVSARTTTLKAMFDTAKSRREDIDRATTKITGLHGNIESEKTGYNDNRKKVSQSRAKITALQANLKNRPTEFSAGEFNQRIRAHEHTLRELESERSQSTNEVNRTMERGKDVNHQIRKIKDEIASLDTQQGQQLNFIRRSLPEVLKAWEWIQENKSQFQQEVYPPPIICCSIKDDRYSDHVQTLLQNDDFQCFTTQNKADFSRLNEQFYKVMSLSIPIRNCAQPLSTFRPPLDAAGAARVHLDGFAIDFLDGPAPVLAMLCSEKLLHKSGVSLSDHTEAQYNTLSQDSGVPTWTSGSHSYSVRRRREYGPDAVSVITKKIFNGRYWKAQPIDMQEKTNLGIKLAELNDEWVSLKAQLHEQQEKPKELENQKDAVMKMIAELRKEKNDLQKEFQRWQSLPDKIESEERHKTTYEAAMQEARANGDDFRRRRDTATVGRAKLVMQHKEALSGIRAAHEAVLEARVWHIEAESDVKGLKARNTTIIARLVEEKEKVAAATRDAAEAKEIGHAYVQELRDLLNDLSIQQQDHITNLAQGKTPEEVQMDLSAEAANLELIHAANPNAIREFDKRAKEIEKVKGKMVGIQEKQGGLTAKLDEIMAKWEPEVDKLVSTINDAFAYNFEHINCAGEVRLHKDDDFDEWALDIMVRFRENETLQKLDAHRQSGGERAVSTVFFLMALQSLAQSPFRVVDEINQGMDPRNERIVHERMVEIACHEYTSQYFLITPKLLTDLRYDPKMRVLCIASGEYLPAEGKKLDFGRCLQIQKRLVASAS